MENNLSTMKTLGTFTAGNISNLVSGVLDNSRDFIQHFIPSASEVAFKEANKNSYAVRNKVSKLSNDDLANIRFLIPERLTGSMLNTLEDVVKGYSTIRVELMEVTRELKNDLSSAINDGIDGMKSPRSYVASRKLAKYREDLSNSLSSNFKATKVTSYGRVLDHFRTTTNIEKYYSQLNSLEVVVNSKEWDVLIESSESLNKLIVEFIDTLKIDREAGDDRYKSRAAKELSDCFFEVAKAHEYIGYLQAKALQLFKSTESLSKSILAYK